MSVRERQAVGQRAAQQIRRPARALIAAAAAIPVLLVAGWVVADAVQPSSYSPVRQTVSVTAGYAGQDRWIMTWSLVLVGLLYLVIAARLIQVRPAARIGLLVAGLAALGVAMCPEPAIGSTAQHAVWTALGELALAVWPALVIRRRDGLIATGRVVGLLATAVSVALMIWVVIETRDGAMLGLAERLASSTQVCWPFVVALSLRVTEHS